MTTLRRSARCTLAYALLLVATILTLIASVAVTVPAAADDTQSAAGVNAAIKYEVQSTGPELTVASKSLYAGIGQWDPAPSGATAFGPDEFSHVNMYNSESVMSWVRYRIAGSSNVFYVTACNPNSMDPKNSECKTRSADCWIEDADRRVVKNSDFSCQIKTSVSGATMQVRALLQPREAASRTLGTGDLRLRRQALDAGCRAAAVAFTSCRVTDVVDVSLSDAPTEPIGKIIVNCAKAGTTHASRVETRSLTGTTTSIGVSTETKLALFTRAKVVLKTVASTTWSESVEQQVRFTITVQPGRYGWLEQSAPLQDVRGTYEVKVGTQSFLIPDVTVTAPLNEGGMAVAVAKSLPIPDAEEGCDDKTDFALSVPTPPRVGGQYRIGLDGANQSVIEAISVHAPVKLGQRSSSNENQLWEVVPASTNPDFVVLRNVGKPELCLNLSGSDNRTVLAWTCTSAIQPNELWATQLDPLTRSYSVVSAEEAARPLAADNAKPDAGVFVENSGSTSTTLDRWVFSPAA